MAAPVMSRRAVLQGLSGLLVGFSFADPSRALAATVVRSGEPIDDKPLASDRLDAWLAITEDNRVIVYSGKVELGTGVETALCQIVADAPDVDFDTTSIIQGDAALTPDQGYTAGSKTIQIGGMQLRRAARSARQLLLRKAAERLSLPIERLETRQGHVHVGGNGKPALAYSQLIDAQGFDAVVEAGDEQPSPSRFVGRSVPRVDIPDKVFGRFAYVQDLRVPGMWHARVIRPPTTGTVAVARLEDVDTTSIPEGVELVRTGNFLAVAAPSEWQAIRAADALRVQWEAKYPLPDMDNLHDTLQAADADEREVETRGDAERALSEHDDILEATYRWPFQAHDSIGPSCAIADVKNDSATIWSGTQGVYPLRASIADLLGMALESVRVIYAEASGCYGHNGADDAAADAALVSQSLGRPVRVQWSRADEHGWAPKGPAMVMALRGAVNAEGRVAGWAFRNWTPSHLTRPSTDAGARNVLAGNLARGSVAQGPPVGGDRNAPVNYVFDHYRASVHWISVEQSFLRCSALRTLGAIQNTFANESFMDELAARAKRDPVAFRLEHLDDARAKTVIERAADRANWTARVSPLREVESAGDGQRGRGIAFACYENEFAYVAAVAEVEVSDRDGIRVRRVTVAHDCGQIVNPDGLENQIEGNVLQAIGRTLKEEVRFDPMGVTSLEWGAYPLLTFVEIPDVDIVLVDRPDEPPVGAGEATSAVIPAAIANAVFDATGRRLRTVPLRWQGKG